MHIRGLTCWLQRHVHGLYGQKWGRCLIQPIQLMKNDVQQNPLIEKTVANKRRLSGKPPKNGCLPPQTLCVVHQLLEYFHGQGFVLL